jgi:hypothetical protein
MLVQKCGECPLLKNKKEKKHFLCLLLLTGTDEETFVKKNVIHSGIFVGKNVMRSGFFVGKNV